MYRLNLVALLVALVVTGCANVPDATRSADDGRVDTRDGPASAIPPMQVTPEPATSTPGDEEAEQSADDLWARIRAGYAIPGHDNARVEREIGAYSTQDAYWRRVSKRARPYLYHIVETLEARDIPMELALLPIVESAFRPFAYSHGRAAGLWQFVPATGEHYGLEQNWWYDGRRDVFAATNAAVDYLSYLSDMFDGDWLLALAAYNAGEGTVQRAIARNRQAGEPTDYWSLDLPRETMNYVPRLLAVSELVADPDQYGIDLQAIPNKPVIAAIDLDQQIDLALAAELAGIERQTLYRLNPGYNRWATPPSGPHRLLLPNDRTQAFRQALSNRPAAEWMRWQRHRIQPAQTLGGIAETYHVSVAALKEANGLRGDLIRAGEHLLVPNAGRPDRAGRRTAAGRGAGGPGRGAAGGGQRRHYIVESGDSLWLIAQRFDVAVQALASWNDMRPEDTLSIGEQLVVWAGSSGDRDRRRQAMGQGMKASARLQTVTYPVREGDSLYRIARRFGTSIDDLRRWNGLEPGTYLQPGQTLRMKVDVTAQRGY